MTLAELLENRFRGDIRYRGAAFVTEERVSITRVTPDAVCGSVEDDEEFETAITREGQEVEFDCSCPQHTRSGVCKHVWATIVAADQEGLTDPATRPGHLLPFLAPHRPGTAGLIDPLQFEEHDDLSDLVGPGQAAPPRPVARWEEALYDLRNRIQERAAAASQPARERRVFYEIDVTASRDSGELVLQTSQQQQRASGNWGKLKALRISPARLTQIESPDDRRYLSLLSGGEPERSSWQTRQAQSNGPAHRFTLTYELARLLLPDLCATGRLRFLDDGDETGLQWDDGPPWEFGLAVLDQDEESWRLHPRLLRGDQELPLSDVRLLVRGGFVITGDSIARLDDFDAWDWVNALDKGHPVEVPRDSGGDLVDRLFEMPVLPRLELPEALRLEEVSAEPNPVLTIFMPSGPGWRRERVLAEVGFEYLGSLVRATSRQHTLVQRAERRCIPRDHAAEEPRWEELEDAGFRRLASDRGSRRDVEIKTRDVGTAVRILAEMGWQVRADGQAVHQSGQVRFRVKSDIDWFDLEADVDFDGRSVKFPDLLSALQRGDSTVRLDDGSLGIVPEEWLTQFGLLAGLGTRQEDGLRFGNNQAAMLDALLATQEAVDYDDRFTDLRDHLQSFDGVNATDEPDGFAGELRGYQKLGFGWLRFLRDFRFGGCLADDMGLGKTVQVLAMLLQHHRGDDTPPSLVVVPRSLMFNWMQECHRFTPELRVLEYVGTDRESLRGTFTDHDVILTTYGTLRRDAVALRETSFSYVVLDEAQTIKNPASQVARASRLLNAGHRIALSGTPIENSLSDLWSIFEFLNPGMLGRSAAFRNHTSNPEDTESRELLARGLRPFILRRSKQQVAAELPEKLEETIYCEMMEDQQRLYDELRLHYRDSLLGIVAERGINKSRMHVLEALLRLRQAACHPALLDRSSVEEGCAKLDYLCPRLEELIAEGHKALVFSQFTSMLSIVRHHLDSRGVVYEYLDGRTRDRQAHVERFQNDPECPVFLISLKAGGLGLNLTAADYVFLLDPWWNPAVEAQAVDRAHRVGQTRPVFAYRLICRGTVEEKIAQLQQKKRDLADAILEADASGVLRDLSVEDLEMLLS